jgi:hypothetical protein
MSQRVVDTFEAVEVEQVNDQFLLGSSKPFRKVFQQSRAIQKAGQGVMPRRVVDLRFSLLPGCDVDANGHVGDGPSFRTQLGRNHGIDPIELAVLGLVAQLASVRLSFLVVRCSRRTPKCCSRKATCRATAALLMSRSRVDSSSTQDRLIVQSVAPIS